MQVRILLVFTIIAAVVLTSMWLFSNDVKQPLEESSRVAELQIEELAFSKVENRATEKGQAKAITTREAKEVHQTESWLTPPTNLLSNALKEFIETEQVTYVNTTFYPFDEETEHKLRQFSKSSRILLFDNTDPEHLKSYGISGSELTSQYFGSASSGDVMLAIGLPKGKEGIQYFVLPVNADEFKLANKVKTAVTELKQYIDECCNGQSS